MIVVEERKATEVYQAVESGTGEMEIEQNWWMKPIVRDLDKQMADVTFMDAEP